ncbi:PD40 domain-containing protein [Candidatus Woesearchaeota archaeon]|nr:PD40 domain-containing protein [Candidatus Woesearchaeota archaeon]
MKKTLRNIVLGTFLAYSPLACDDAQLYRVVPDDNSLGECDFSVIYQCQDDERKIEYRTPSCDAPNNGFKVEEREQICNDGTWGEFGDWYETKACPEIPVHCSEGTINVERQILVDSCGLNNRGATVEERSNQCIEGTWAGWSDFAAVGDCYDFDNCVDGSTILEANTCGLNGEGLLTKICVNGAYEFVSCIDPAQCLNETTFEVPCGINGRGTVTVSCVEGTPVSESCMDTDLCRDGETRDTDYHDTSCGLNGRGIILEETVETCINGNWLVESTVSEDRTSCFDPDECVDGTERTEVCGINNAGQQRKVCVDGIYVNDGSCIDDDVCRNATDYGTISCGNEDSGSRGIACNEGNLLIGECTGEIEPAICTGLEGKVLFSKYGDIYIGNASNLEETNLTNTDSIVETEYNPKWSPDKSKIAFVSFLYTNPASLDVFVMNADGSDRRNISNNSYSQDNYPTWYPDGTKIAFYLSTDSTDVPYGLRIINLNTDEITDPNIKYISDFKWSLDGNKTIFIKAYSHPESSYTSEICTADGNFSSITRLTYSDVYTYNKDPSYSPDGRKILFSSNREGNKDIYVMNADGTNQINLTNSSLEEQNPIWSPGGSKIMFERYDEERCTINVMDNDGTNVTTLEFGELDITECSNWHGIDWKE